nr:F-box protein At1g78100-like [Quercus suber]POE69018.1 f-box protein [Quercus suber]
MDGFDRIPDPLILFIFNSLSDVKTLIRCRAVSKRFNSLVPQTESLLLKVDRVISPESDESDTPFLNFFKTIVKSVHNLVSLSAKTHPELQTRPARSQNCPAQILRGFERIRDLVIELPAGDLKLDRNAVVKWRAEFGKTLKNCVIFAFRGMKPSTSTQIPAEFADMDFAGGLKLRVVWTISALIAASARHYLLRELVEEHEEIEKLVLTDKEGEGTLVMNKEGLAELRAAGVAQVSEHKEWAAHYRGWDQESNGSRTMVPSVRMRMRHVAKTELKSGEWLDGATLVVVRPTTIMCKDGVAEVEVDDVEEDVAADVNLALKAFEDDGACGEAVQALVKTRSYHLEMNSF